ncbi:hypothetical protein QTI66_25450 [Variovorax sp. J22R133]|uniref:hypothetical protein n=1 Tax=Variovorax brevis TaxID=3053503 RepID=UPI00257825D8|nr:hypothetical protein [Variovorax sp. J22R133]MDM0115520.1 hypothetical protein [Variovorax sp. J22R133]
MQIRDLNAADLEAVYDLLRDTGWQHRRGTRDEFELLVAASQRAAVAVASAEEVIGFARAFTDGLCIGYPSIVAVALPSSAKASAVLSCGMS